MKALTWHGKGDVRCEHVPDPTIEHPRDAIIKATACAICGSDLHLFDGVMPEMEKGDVLGHETMGEVVEVESENTALKIGDRLQPICVPSWSANSQRIALCGSSPAPRRSLKRRAGGRYERQPSVSRSAHRTARPHFAAHLGSGPGADFS
jgi:threonine dehydrogenase-like Zn-dependent dehydrogenase